MPTVRFYKPDACHKIYPTVSVNSRSSQI